VKAAAGHTDVSRIPAKVKKKQHGDVELRVSEEVLTINGRQVRCRVERSPAISVWRAPEIPGGVARLQSPITLTWVVAWAEAP
jgi:hypothetical protein